jgi:hypothetical protein
MKKTATLFLLLCSMTAGAQYYFNSYLAPGMNPGGLNNDNEYPVGGGLDASWTTIHNPSASPAWSTVQTIPFSFNFDGSPVTQYIVSNSGVVTFDVSTSVTAPSFTNTAIPTASIPNSSVMVWGIKGTATNDKVCSKTFGTAPFRQHWIFFTSYSFGSSTSNYTYWSIMLQETTNNIYIVDQRSSGTVSALTVGIQANSTTAYALNSGNNSVSSLAATDFTPADNIYYEFIPGSQPSYDLGTISESVASYLVLSQAPFSIVGGFTNFGTQTVSSYNMNYSINNGPAVSGAISSVSVASGASTTGTHPTGWVPATTGTYTVSLWPTNINGNADQYAYNDTMDFVVTIVDTMTIRNTLMEVFTSSTCGPCAPGNANMDNNVVPNIANYTIIKYQQDFPGSGDPYQTTTAVNRRGYYGINSIPRMELDGQWDQNASSLTTSIFNGYQSEPAFMEIAIQSATTNGTTVSVAATIKPLITYAGNNFSYHTVIVERQTLNNVATNGETEFHYVMMKMYPNENGTAVTSLTAMNTINVNQTVPMSGTFVEEYSDLRLVIFVQDNVTKKILQSEWMDITQAISVSELDNDGEGITNLYPNPANNSTSFGVKVNDAKSISWTMTNMVGQVIMTGQEANAQPGETRFTIGTASLPEGVYFVNVMVGDKMYTQKVVVSH